MKNTHFYPCVCMLAFLFFGACSSLNRGGTSKGESKDHPWPGNRCTIGTTGEESRSLQKIVFQLIRDKAAKQLQIKHQKDQVIHLLFSWTKSQVSSLIFPSSYCSCNDIPSWTAPLRQSHAIWWGPDPELQHSENKDFFPIHSLASHCWILKPNLMVSLYHFSLSKKNPREKLNSSMIKSVF